MTSPASEDFQRATGISRACSQPEGEPGPASVSHLFPTTSPVATGFKETPIATSSLIEGDESQGAAPATEGSLFGTCSPTASGSDARHLSLLSPSRIAVNSPSSASFGGFGDEGQAACTRLLREEAAKWFPPLREMLPSEGPSLLLGQIRFDVTTEEQRGSWLLPEELLLHHEGLGAEEQEDRQIFTNTPVSDEEQEAVDQILLHLLEAQQNDLAEEADRSSSRKLVGVEPAWLEQLVLRYLYSCLFDKQKTLELLQSTLAFRMQQLPVLESEVYSELRNIGACYWHGRDRRLRPLLVVSLQKMQLLQREADAKVTRLVIFCLEFFLRYLCVAGVVESWCILCDLNGTSLSSFPLPLLLKLIQLIQGAYRGRLYRFYILYAPRLFQFVAKPLVAALPATTAKKVRVYTHPDEWNQERRMQFASHQLEQKFGGTAPNITENWYPFRFFPGPFNAEDSPDPSIGSGAAVRWDSERALHTKVHPLVHTGTSLHTSVLRRSLGEQQAGASNPTGAPVLRYAAWLQHLPQLSLTSSTICWAIEMLRTSLNEHHHCLLQHLGGASQRRSKGGSHQEPAAEATRDLSAGEAPEAQTTAELVPSLNTSSADGVSRAASPVVESLPMSAPAAPLLAPARPEPVRSRTLSPCVGRSTARCSESVAKRLPAADPPAEAASFASQQLPSVPFSKRARECLTLNESYSPPSMGRPGSREEKRRGRPDNSSFMVRDLRGNCAEEDPGQQQQRLRQPPPALSSSRNGLQSPPVSSTAPGYVSASRDIKRSPFYPYADAPPPRTHNTEEPVQPVACDAGGCGLRGLQQMFGEEVRHQPGETHDNGSVNLGLQPRMTSREIAEQPREQLRLRKQGEPTCLRHPASSPSGASGGSCQAESLSAAAGGERALGTPPGAAWRDVPACELSPQWRGSFCSGASFLQSELLHSDGTRPNSLDCPDLSASTKRSPENNKTTKGLKASALILGSTTTATGPGFLACRSDACLGEGSARSPTVAPRLFERRASRHVSCSAGYPGSAPRWSLPSMAGNIHSPSMGDSSQCFTYPSGRLADLYAPYGALADLPDRDTWRRRDTAKCGVSTPSSLLGRNLLLEPETSEDRSATVLAARGAGRVVKFQRLRRRKHALRGPLSEQSGSSGKNASARFACVTNFLRLKRHHRSCAREQREKAELLQLDGHKRRKLRYIALGRPLSLHLLSCNAATESLNPAAKRGCYRRMRVRLWRGSAARWRFATRDNASTMREASASHYEVLADAPSTARSAKIAFRDRGASSRFTRMSTSLSDRLRRGTRVLARLMQGKAGSPVAI